MIGPMGRAPIVDADVHPLTRNCIRDVLPGLSKGWQRRLDLYATFGVGRRPSPIAGPQNTGHNYAKDAYPPGGGRPGSDPRFLVEHHLDTHGIGAAILLPPELLGAARLTMVEDAVQLVRAYNDYFIREWLPVDRADVIVSFHTERADLERRVAKLLEVLHVDGGLWIAWPKKASGVATDLTFEPVQEIGLDCGLVDNKVCAVDDTWSALRFVVRVADRPSSNGR